MKIILLSILIFVDFVFCQSDTTDFFPLSIGYKWIYNYHTNSIDDLNGFENRDSGTAVYSITSQTISDDSTVWELREIRDIISTFSQSYPPQSTTIDTIKDTTEFSIIEYHSGNHRMVRTGNRDLFSVFPFYEDFQDSVSFFRYFPSEISDTFSVNIHSSSAYYENYYFSLQRNIGITKISFYYSPQLVGYNVSTNHTLKSFVTSIDNINFEEPKHFEILQNYPNPFNPITKISFSLPYSGNVEIKIFDILGNEIETLVDEYKQIGSYEIDFDASNLPSGVYFYRIISGSYSETKKMIFLR